MAARADLVILAAALIWGVAFYFQKTAMDHVGPLLFVGVRGAIAALVLLPFALLEHRRVGPAPNRVFAFSLIGGAVFCLASAVQQEGLITATVTNTGLITALYVVGTPLIYWLVRREQPANTVWLAVAFAAVGLWLLSGGSLVPFHRGDYLVAFATVFWSLQLVIAGEASRFQRPWTFTAAQFCIVGLAGLALAFAFEDVSLKALKAAAPELLYVGVLSTALTSAAAAWAMQHTTAPRVAIVLSTEIIFSVAAGYYLLDERLAPIGWLGAALILCAVVAVRLRRANSEV